MKVPKCPKCGKYPKYIVQCFKAKMFAEISHDGILLTEPQDPYQHERIKVIAVCSCLHEWTVRGTVTASIFETKGAGNE